MVTICLEDLENITHLMFDAKDRLIKVLDEVVKLADQDSYNLTRGEQSSIEWRVRQVQDYIRELYSGKITNG